MSRSWNPPPITEPDAATGVLTAPNLNLDWVAHGFSTRRAGTLGFTREEARSSVESNRQDFLERVGGGGPDGAWPLVTLRQVHSDLIRSVDAPLPEPVAGDGLITQTPHLTLAVKTADCLPILLVDTRRRAVAAVHAGWRGTLARVAEKAVGEMRRNFRTDPADVLAAIGPGIHVCCYEVADDFRERFGSQFTYAEELFEEQFSSDPVRQKYPLLFMNMRAPGHGEPPRRLHLNLVEANRRQLLAGGVPEANIWASPLCTACRSDLLFSYRADKAMTGRMLGVIAIRSR